MKYILTIFLFISYSSFATNYYVSNAGNNSNAGTSTGASWQTLYKVNSFSLSTGFVAGDTIFLKRGDTWNDSLRIYSSGAVGNPIVITAYGTGNKPVLTGFQSLSMSDAGGNIWTGTATNSVKKQNTVLVNGSLRIKARYPNATTLTYTTSTTTYILIPHTATNYIGSEIVVNGATWELGLAKITAQVNDGTNDTLKYDRAMVYGAGATIGGNGYFFQNMTAFLDVVNEWAYDSTTKLVSVYATSSPAVKYSSIDTLVSFQNVSNITIDGIEFTGANWLTGYLYYTKNIVFQNCKAENISDGFYSNHSNGLQFVSDTVVNSLNTTLASAYDTTLVVTGNYFYNTGIYAGMGKTQFDGFHSPYIGYGGYTSIFNYGDNFTISNNKIINTGYVAVRFTGRNGAVYQNEIDNFCFVKTDGSAIMTWLPTTYNWDSGTVIRKNIIRSDSITPKGVILNGGWVIRSGIYLDQFVNNVTIDSNSISNLQFGLFIKGKNNTVTRNLIYDSLGQYNIYIQVDTVGFVNTVTHNTVYNFNPNIVLFAAYKAKLLTVHHFYDTVAHIINYNHYMNLTGSTSLYMMGNSPYTAASFKAKCPYYDINANYSFPATSTSTTARYIINNTLSDSVVVLSAVLGTGFVDQDGSLFYNSVTLKPFTSKLIFPSSSFKYYGFKIGNIKFK